MQEPLNGMYLHQIEEVADIGKTYSWLEKAGLKDGIEGLLMSAQEYWRSKGQDGGHPQRQSRTSG